MVRWAIGSMMNLLSYFSFEPVLHNWANKGRRMYYPLCRMMHKNITHTHTNTPPPTHTHTHTHTPQKNGGRGTNCFYLDKCRLTLMIDRLFGVTDDRRIIWRVLIPLGYSCSETGNKSECCRFVDLAQINAGLCCVFTLQTILTQGVLTAVFSPNYPPTTKG